MNCIKILALILFSCLYIFTFGQMIALTQFDAQLSSAHIFLEWEIGDSVVNSPFEIQRSTDGKLFETIGQVGITSETYYAYIDSSAKGYYPILYYRLRQKQNDLFALYSSVVSLQKINVSATKPIIFPNPVNDVLSLDYAPSDGSWMFVKIADQAGRIIYQSPRITHIHLPQWDVSMLATGVYQLIIVSQSEIQTLSWLKK